MSDRSRVVANEIAVMIMKPDHVGLWLDTPNEAFSGLKPLDLIERGEMDRLWRVTFEVQSGSLT